MLLLNSIVVLAYSLLIGSFVWGFDKVNVFKLADSPTKTSFSVVIPFRNEAENLLGLLESISKLKYPRHKFEIIFVDDDSNDGSTEIIERFFLIKENSKKKITNKNKKWIYTELINIKKLDY